MSNDTLQLRMAEVRTCLDRSQEKLTEIAASLPEMNAGQIIDFMLEIDRARLRTAAELDRIADDLGAAKIKDHYSC